MGLPEPKPESFVTVKALLPTTPYPRGAARPSVTTERLLIRPLAESDLDGYYALRTQAEVMAWTPKGVPDDDKEYTRKILGFYLPPNNLETLNFAICLKEKPDELIGAGGSHKRHSSMGWPEIGYMIRSEHWGKGIATEFVKGFLELWKALPRAVEEFKVDDRTVVKAANGNENDLAEEMIVAVTSEDNVKSQKILNKCGFEHLLTWEALDTQEQKKGQMVNLPTYCYYASKKATN